MESQVLGDGIVLTPEQLLPYVTHDANVAPIYETTTVLPVSVVVTPIATYGGF